MRQTVIKILLLTLILALLPQPSAIKRSLATPTTFLSTAPNNLGLVGYWSFNEGKGTQATDFSGGGNTGTFNGSPGWINGKRSFGLSFNGTTDHVSVTNTIASVTTISFWMKANSTTQRVLALTATQYIELVSGTVTATGFTTPTIYVDGAAASTVDTNWHFVTVVSGAGISANAIDFGDSGGNFYSGNLDEVRFYNRALASGDVSSLYTAGSIVMNASRSLSEISGLVGWWTFDGADTTWTGASSGTTVDNSVSNFTGTLNGMTQSGSPVAGEIGQGLNFNGSNSYVSIGAASSTVNTVSFWAKPNTTTQSILELNGTASVSISAGTVAATGFTTPTIYIDGAATSTFPSDGAWHQILITTATSINASAMNIGKISTTYYAGSLDDVRLYSRVVASAEITRIYRATSPSTIVAKAVTVSQDFKVQRGETIMAGSTTSVTITAGVDYTAPASATSAFIRIVSQGQNSNGNEANFSGGASATSAAITNPQNILTSVTFARTATSTAQLRVEWEIIEYIGSAGGANEFIVRKAQAITVANGTNTANSASVAGVVSDAKVAVFLTGVNPAAGGRTEYEELDFVTSWDTGLQRATVTKASTGGTIRGATVSVAVVEFTGSNWNVQRIQHTYVAGSTTETENLTTPVGSVSKTFIQAQKMVAGDSIGPNPGGQEVWLSSTTQLSFATFGSPGTTTMTAVVWVVENTQSTNTPMSVVTISGTRSATNVANETATDTISAVSSLATASIWGETARESGNNQDNNCDQIGFSLTNTTTVTGSRGFSCGTLTYHYEVVQWPSAP